MKLSESKFLLRFSLIIITLFSTHALLFRAFSSFFMYSFQTLVEIYIFLIVLTVVYFFALKWLFTKWPKYSGFIFTGLSLFKMAISVIFLLPYIISSNTESVPIAISFMILYLVLLAYEVVFIARSMVKNH